MGVPVEIKTVQEFSRRILTSEVRTRFQPNTNGISFAKKEVLLVQLSFSSGSIITSVHTSHSLICVKQ